MSPGESMTCPHCDGTCEAHHNYCPGCGFPVAKLRDQVEDPLIGTTLPGGHVVLELVDVGGMGRVYRAEQQMLGRTVAVKIIHPHLTGDPTAEARFLNEARAASRLNHPNSVGVIDLGKLGDRFFMVMEFLRGRDLATVAHQEGPLAVARVVDIVRQILAALGEAHHHGIIHRDLKPENVVLEALRSGGDFVKVLDFGLAKVREAAQKQRVTSPGMVCGTPEYMAPEQIRGEAIDHRSDLYACGVLLFELLTGRLPFDGGGPNEIVLQHLTALPPDPRTVAPGRAIPAALADVVAKALAKDPAARFQSAGEMSMALEATLALAEARPQRPSGELLRCDGCGAAVPRTQKFCGECGALVKRRRPSVPPTASVAVEPPATEELPFVGREQELGWLLARREQTEALGCAAVVAPAGFGKTRLLTELMRECERRGDAVVTVGADPWWAEQGLYAVREAITQLADLPDETAAPGQWVGTTPEARAGLALVLGVAVERPPPVRRRWSETPPEAVIESNQRILVAEALRWALAVAQGRSRKGLVVLAIDDLNALDGASRNAFADVIAEPPFVRALLVAAYPPSFDPGWDGNQVLFLPGLPAALATELLGPEAQPPAAPAGGRHRPSRIAPLYVDQLRRFVAAGGVAPPPGLADLVAARIALLPADTRRVLQAVAVLGDAAVAAQLVALLPDLTDLGRHLAELRRAGLTAANGGLHGVSHPLVRDVVLASTPRAVRRHLHSLARRDFGVDDLKIPPEAHALHAFHAGESFEALMLLEQLADRSAVRGDHQGRIRALRLALELGRRELGRGELDDPLSAVLIFSCKLGDALASVGQHNDADGVLSEALHLAGPSAEERPRLLASLASVARGRGLAEKADEYLSEALQLARQAGRRELIESLAQMRATWG